MHLCRKQWLCNDDVHGSQQPARLLNPVDHGGSGVVYTLFGRLTFCGQRIFACVLFTGAHRAFLGGPWFISALCVTPVRYARAAIVLFNLCCQCVQVFRYAFSTIFISCVFCRHQTNHLFCLGRRLAFLLFLFFTIVLAVTHFQSTNFGLKIPKTWFFYFLLCCLCTHVFRYAFFAIFFSMRFISRVFCRHWSITIYSVSANDCVSFVSLFFHRSRE